MDFTAKLATICINFTQSLLPQRCLLCEVPSGGMLVCSACEGDLPYAPENRCPCCAIPLPQTEICGECLRDPPAFTSAQAVFDYAFPVDGLLSALKFGNRLELAPWFAQMLVTRLDCERLPDLIVPMPLHAERMKVRGFNQALEIARHVSRTLAIPLAALACTRTRATAAQVGLKREERRKNMRRAFACHASLAGKYVAVIDDVMTSGATARALATAIQGAGAADIQLWLVARTGLS